MDFNNLTDEQKAQILETAKKLEKEKQEKANQERKEYEELRNSVVTDFIGYAAEMSELMKKYHAKMMPNILSFGELMREFGDMPKRSKGGFSIMNDECNERVTLIIRNIGEFNEMADMAEEHIRNFLEGEIKTASNDAYELIVTLLERKKGKLEYSRAMQILKYEDKFNDPNWKKGCQLLKDSFVMTDSKYYLEFEKKNEFNQWEKIPLNFSSIWYKVPNINIEMA